MNSLHKENQKTTMDVQINKRWTIILGGFLLSLMGGMSYAWGSFVVPLVKGGDGQQHRPCSLLQY